MLPSSSDNQQPQKNTKRGSILLEPVPATGSGSASSFGTHLSGTQNLHTELLLSCMTMSARKRPRGSEHMETKTMKRKDDRSKLIVPIAPPSATMPVVPARLVGTVPVPEPFLRPLPTGDLAMIHFQCHRSGKLQRQPHQRHLRPDSIWFLLAVVSMVCVGLTSMVSVAAAAVATT